MDYLGVILEKGVTRMDPVKVSGVRNWPIPTCVKDICKFLGFCNFYHVFMPGFTSHALPLNHLTCKGEEFRWVPREQAAFDKLKLLITSELVLAHPHLDRQFEVEVDASGYAVGAVLLQKDNDGCKHPIGYFSTTLNKAQRNYDIYNLEFLAIFLAFDNW